MASSNRSKKSAPSKKPAQAPSAARPKPAAQPKSAAQPRSGAQPKKPPVSRLGVRLDGEDLDDAAARALWIEFSEYMDDNVGDLAGFAKKRGWASVSPEHVAGRAILVARTKP